MMIAGVVADDDDAPPWGAAQAFELFQKGPTGLRIEAACRSRHEQFTVIEAHRAEEADAFTRGGMQANRICDLWRNPQRATRAMLLKVNLIHCPQVDVDPSSQALEFFYARLALRDQLGRLEDAACANEIRVGGTAVGTA